MLFTATIVTAIMAQLGASSPPVKYENATAISDLLPFFQKQKTRKKQTNHALEIGLVKLVPMSFFRDPTAPALPQHLALSATTSSAQLQTKLPKASGSRLTAATL